MCFSINADVSQQVQSALESMLKLTRLETHHSLIFFFLVGVPVFVSQEKKNNQQ